MQRTGTFVRDVIEWDVENWSRALSFWERRLPSPGGGLGLELGARRGGLSLWLASRGYDVVCSDLENNERAARPLHERYGVAHRIRYAAHDALDLPYTNELDVVAFKSLLGGVAWNGDVERSRRAVHQMHKSLRPGGALLFAENLRGSAFHRSLRRAFVRWKDVWRYVELSEMRSFLEPFSHVEYETGGFLGLCGRSPALASAFGRIDGALFNRIVPPAQRYIVYGVAWK